MITNRFKYTMLMSSLPPHNLNLFKTRHPPISKIQLERRLQWLEPQDAEDLEKIQGLLYWANLNDETDAEFIQNTEKMLATIKNSFLRDVISWRLELRTIILALRKRHLAKEKASYETGLGFGKWPFYIEKNWQQPDFGLSRQIPWINQANELIENHDSFVLEKMLLEMVWQHYEQFGNGHYFDFEAVIIYVLRWDVINRWNKYNSQQALERFSSILQSNLQGMLVDGQ